MVCTLLPLLFASYVQAHSPHDPIDALVVAPSPEGMHDTLFVAISDQLLKSNDGGYSWKQLANGLDNSHLITAVCTSPFYREDHTLFFATDGDGVYRSEDGGDSWTKDNEGLDEHRLKKLDMSPAGRLFAVDMHGRLWTKEVSRNRWVQAAQNLTGITALGFPTTDPGKGREGEILFLGTHEGAFYVSFNGGIQAHQKFTWQNSGPITVIATSPDFHEDAIVMAGTSQKGIWKSTDSGETFEESNNGITDRQMVDIAFVPENGGDFLVYATTWNEAVFYSADKGASWQLLPQNLTTSKQANSAAYHSPHFRHIQASGNFRSNHTVFVGGFDGLFVSHAAGRTWKQLETLPLSLIKGLDTYAMAGRSSIAITTYGGGAYISQDAGHTWTIANSGLVTTRLSDIRFSPAYDRDATIFSASKRYLLKSKNNGKSWNKIDLKYYGLRRKAADFLNTIMITLGIRFSWTDLLVSELEQMKPWPTLIAISPGYDTDKTLFFGTREHGVYRSTEEGKNAEILWNAGGRPVTSLVISPGYGSDKTLFTSVRGLGVYRSTDQGKSWSNLSEGFDFISKWRHNETVHQIEKKDIKLTISPDFKNDHTLFARSSEGLYKSTNAGTTWQVVDHAVFKENKNVIGAAISPDYRDDGTLVVSLKGKGLYRTRDGGRTFNLLNRDLVMQHHNIEYLAFSPAYRSDKTILAASDETVFISTDEGENWKLLKRPVRYENNRKDVVRYDGTWLDETNEVFSAGSISTSSKLGSSVELDFVGTGITWVGPESTRPDAATVFLDNKKLPTDDLKEKDAQHGNNVLTIKGLLPGSHQLRIQVGANQNAGMTENVSIDAFDVIP